MIEAAEVGARRRAVEVAADRSQVRPGGVGGLTGAQARIWRRAISPSIWRSAST